MSNVGSLALRGCAIAATPSMLKANVRNVCFVIDFKFYVRVKNIRIGLHCQNYKVFTAQQIFGAQKNKQRIPTGFSTFLPNSGKFLLVPYTKGFGRITHFLGNDLATVPFAAFCLDLRFKQLLRIQK
jgi:hypothetical protein